MTYATIMVHYGFEGNADGRLRLAKGLAEKFNATVIGVAARAVTPIVAEGILVPVQMGSAEYLDLHKLLLDQEQKFKKSAGSLGSEWRSAIEPPTSFLSRQSRSADLIVVEQHGLTANLYDSLDPAGLILAAGRPVLVVPSEVHSLEAKVVVVGWKESRESRRAILDSLPLLRKAERVYVVGVREGETDDDEKRGIDDVSSFLGRHKVKAHPRLVTSTERKPADALIHVARSEEADLIVAGAYGRSRVGEWIFGGVTQDLLRSSPFCCLFSH
jgi:nucleotide-binding universal stress UspA family protein